MTSSLRAGRLHRWERRELWACRLGRTNLYFEYHRGIFTTQAGHKRDNRKSEIATLDAEKFASLAWLKGMTYPAADLTESWKKITFNQFHDLAAGSGIAVIYRDAQKDFTEVYRSDREINATSMQTLEASINTSGSAGTPVLVTNALGWPRSEAVPITVQLPEANAKNVTVSDSHGVVPSQILSTDAATRTYHLLVRTADVPALGYSTLHVASDAKAEFKAGDKAAGTDLKLDETPAAFTLSQRSPQGCDRSPDRLHDFAYIVAGREGVPRTEELWQPAANVCGHAQKLRRLEHRSWHARRHHDPDQQA